MIKSTLFKFLSSWSAKLGLFLIFVAVSHRLMIDSVAIYTHGAWVSLVFLVFLGTFLSAVILFVKAIIALVDRKWPDVLYSSVSAVFLLGCVISAMYIDAPTLIYMT